MTANRRPLYVREYGFLTRSEALIEGENAAELPKSAFDYLRRAIQEETSPNDFSRFLKLTTYRRKIALKVQNYVGVLQTPCGTSIEILPKLADHEKERRETTRQLLIKMLRCLRNSRFSIGGQADIHTEEMPLLELYVSQFLRLTNQLIKRGVRSDYSRQRKNALFLKGRLLVTDQIRKNTMHPERFFIEYDEYQIDQPANRLIKSALQKIHKITQSISNQRLAKELLFVFEDVPLSKDVDNDFLTVKQKRGMGYYQDVLRWCALILNRQGPTASSGNFNTFSFLYPMERLFEDYVAHWLKKKIETYFVKGAVLKIQSSNYSLIEKHNGKEVFKLKPDFVVQDGEQTVCVMDAKWKRIDSSNREKRYGISQSDMYQLYAYGHKYLKKEKHKKLVLIYPKTEKFQKPLKVFEYEENFELTVVPFDLDKGNLVDFSINL